MTVSGSAFTASLEGGYPFRLAPAWSIEPQGQLIYQYLQMNTGSDAYGITSFGDTDDVRARIGAKVAYVTPGGFAGVWPATIWGRVNLWHDFLGSAPSATFATLFGGYPTTLDGTLGRDLGQIELGVDAHLNKTLSLYGSGFYDHNLGSGESWSAGGRIGIKAEF